MNKYPKYKPSGIQWIGEIPEHWICEKIKYKIKVQSSNIDKKKHENANKTKIIHYNDVVKNDLICDDYIFDYGYCSDSQFKAFKLNKGDILITKDSMDVRNIGDICLIKSELNDIVYGYHLSKFSIYDSDILHKYLFYFLSQKELKDYFLLNSTGVTIIGIGKSVLENTSFILPPLPEQTAIANYLDKKTAQIDELISKKQRLLKLYEEEKTAIINQAVTRGLDPNAPMKDSGIEWLEEIPEHWEVIRIKNICKVNQGLQIPISERTYIKTKESLPYITIKAINNPNDITEYILNPSTNVICHKDDILVARTGTTGEIITRVEGVFHNNFFKVDYNRKKVIKDFLVYFLQSTKIKEYLLLVAGTTTIPDLNHNDFYNIPFFQTSKEEQSAIVKYIETEIDIINAKAEKTKKLIELLKEYRTALISEAVTGKIKVC